MSQRRAALSGWLLLLFIALVAMVSLRPRLPAVKGETAPPEEFSAARALTHLREIARQPHPMGSAEHDRVRDYLLATLADLGVEAEVQAAVAVNDRWRPPRLGSVENILARLPGTGGGKAILVAGHYDSVHTGPGASDDGAAVAAMLETLRALEAGPPLANDVLFLFTDGEEAGLLGAAAFVHEHPERERVGLVLNFEARGSRGESIMFQTSRGNGRLVREFARAVPHPVASSLTYEVYKFLPNDTDFTFFRQAQLPGFDFAFIEGYTAYHTRRDDLDALDPRSLQHHGENALALVRRFGGLDLEGVKRPDAVYFNLFGRSMVIYPGAWALPLAAGALVLAIAVLAVGRVRRRLRGRAVARGALEVLLAIVASAVAVWLARWAVFRIHPSYRAMPFGDLYNAGYYLAAFALLAAAVTLALFARARRGIRAAELGLGGALVWLVLTAVTSALLPGVSFLFLWPLVFGLVALLGHLLMAGEGEDELPWVLVGLLALCALPVLSLLVPNIGLLFVGLPLLQALAFLPPLAAGAIALIPLTLALLVPQLDRARLGGRPVLPLLALAASLGFLVAGSLTAGFDQQRPRPDSLRYELDAQQGTATWVTFDSELGPWNAGFFPAGERRPRGRGFEAPAPLAALTPPAAELVADDFDGGRRRLSLRLTSRRGAPNLRLRCESDLVEIQAAEVAGRRIEARGGVIELFYYALPPEGLEIHLEMQDRQPVTVEVQDLSFGFPDLPGSPVPPRPADAMPRPHPATDQTAVKTSYMF